MSEAIPQTPEQAASSLYSSVEITDSLRAAVAGGGAAKLIATSASLFEAGGKNLLSQSAQRMVRAAAEKGAKQAILTAAGPVLETASGLARGLESVSPASSALAFGARAVKSSGKLALGAGKTAFRVASEEVLKGAGRAAGVGFVIDGAVAGLEAVIAVRNGSTDKVSAAKYVAKEATTGAVATGAGVLLGAGLVALTGGIAAPVVFAVGAMGSLGTKRLLRRLIK
ncbi:MAG: hypothetical protein JWP97_3829 [Labilithrix sp.]|nr:hypothetical protein [Labilithrix sp.]